MHISQFDLASIPAGSKDARYLEVATLPGGEPVTIPVLVARGQDGPTLVVLGGVHGDEYPGPLAIPRVWQDIDPVGLIGAFVGIPVVNSLAWAAGTRENPVDGGNLARLFPGSARGSISQILAHWVYQKFLRTAAMVLDLHSGGTNYAIPRLCGYYLLEGELGDVSRTAAIAFGAPVLWGTPLNSGRTISEAVRAGVPGIYAEVPGGAAYDPADMDLYVSGTRNVMRYLGMLPGPFSREAPPVSVESRYDLDEPIRARHGGIFDPRVRILDAVEAGQLLGVVLSPLGEVLDHVRTDRNGLVFLLRTRPVVTAGDVLAVVT